MTQSLDLTNLETCFCHKAQGEVLQRGIPSERVAFKQFQRSSSVLKAITHDFGVKDIRSRTREWWEKTRCAYGCQPPRCSSENDAPFGAFCFRHEGCPFKRTAGHAQSAHPQIPDHRGESRTWKSETCSHGYKSDRNSLPSRRGRRSYR